MKIEENKLKMKENFSKKIKDMLLIENCDMSCSECPMNIFENENISCLDIARSLYETYIKEDKKDDIQ